MIFQVKAAPLPHQLQETPKLMKCSSIPEMTWVPLAHKLLIPKVIRLVIIARTRKQGARKIKTKRNRKRRVKSRNLRKRKRTKNLSLRNRKRSQKKKGFLGKVADQWGKWHQKNLHVQRKSEVDLKILAFLGRKRFQNEQNGNNFHPPIH